MISICTLIKKLLLLVIVMGVLCTLTLPISFGDSSVVSINSPLAQPEPFLTQEDGVWHLRTFIIFKYAPGSHNGIYAMVQMDMLFESQPLLLYNQDLLYAGVVSSVYPKDNKYTVTAYDLSSGNILEYSDNIYHRTGGTGVYTAGNFMPYGYYWPAVAGNGNTIEGGYCIAPSDNIRVGSAKMNVEPFVVFSQFAPDHNLYHSQLSEPVWDQYNRYFILDDKLYWLSYRIQGVYALVDDVNISSTTEDFTAEGDYVGVVQQSSLNGLATFGSQVSYHDYEVYPVNVMDSQYFDSSVLYPAVTYSSSGVDVDLVLDDLGVALALGVNKLYVDYTFYLSSFALVDGSYSESRYYSSAELITSSIHIDRIADDVDDVRCYGVVFRNIDNMPVNLSDVQWQYDLEFFQWRESMLSMLTQIYNSLSGEEVTTASFTDPSWNEDLNQNEPTTIISNSEIKSVFVGNFQEIKPSPSAEVEIANLVDMVSIPKLIAVCCFALAMGTVILTLGKKKND